MAINEGHPFIDGMFHHLVSLTDPGIGVSESEKSSSFRWIQKQLQEVRLLSSNLFLGPIYTQTVMSHIDLMSGVLYANTSHYWLASFNSVDKTLGSKQEYIDLVRASKTCGMQVIQDVVFNNIGYLPQNNDQKPNYISVLADQGVIVPDSVDLISQAYLWGKWRSVHDESLFYKGKPISDDAYREFENAELGTDTFRWAVNELQTGELFGLHKINLENKEILDAVINDHLWYIEEAGVTQFRIDAAKHIRPKALKTIVDTLMKKSKSLYPNEFSAVFLEYWSANYKNFRHLCSELGDETFRGVYLFDYPLGAQIRGCLIYGDSFDKMNRVVQLRTQYQIPLKWLIPLFMDHDFFTGIFNGSIESESQVLSGYVIAIMMSANFPHIYNGFEKADWGVKKSEHMNPVRKPIRQLIDKSSTVFTHLHAILSDVRIKEFIQHSSAPSLSTEQNRIEIRRELKEKKQTLVAEIVREGNGLQSEHPFLYSYQSKFYSFGIYCCELQC